MIFVIVFIDEFVYVLKGGVLCYEKLLVEMFEEIVNCVVESGF